jgi:putative PIN family toxin of toxin-antitoxin system
VSPLLLAELDEVLRRVKFRPYVTLPEVDAYLELIRTSSVVIADPESVSGPRSADPGDQYLIDLAAAARVDALVSGDPHLLDLRGRIPVTSPREFLDSLGDRSP